MPEQAGPDARAPEPFEELRPNAPVFAVAPVSRRTRLPAIMLVGLVVGVVAFVAGIGVASAGPAPQPGPSVGPAAPVGSAPVPGASPVVVDAGTGADADTGADPAGTPAAAAVPDAAASQPGASPVAAGSSVFATSFDPAAIAAAAGGGAACSGGEPRDKVVPRTRRDGPRLTFQRSWLLWCPIPGERREAFLLDVIEATLAIVPADTYGYTVEDGGGGDALIPYAQPPLSGTVAVAADAAGEGLAIAIVLEEWLADPAR